MFNSTNVITATNEMLKNYNDAFQLKQEGKLEAATNVFNRSVFYCNVVVSNMMLGNIITDVLHGKDLAKYVFTATVVVESLDSIINAINSGSKIADPFIEAKASIIRTSKNTVQRYFAESEERVGLGRKFAVMRCLAESITATLGDVGHITTFKACDQYICMKKYWQAA